MSRKSDIRASRTEKNLEFGVFIDDIFVYELITNRRPV